MRVITFLLALLLILAVAGCTASDDPDDDPGPTDVTSDAQIYATAIRQIYTVDHSFSEPPLWSLIYLVSTTNDSVMLDAPTGPPQNLPAALQKEIQAELADLPGELIWIDSLDDVLIDPADGQIAQGEGIVITLGNIHPQEDDSVQLPFFMTCGGLCGIGKTYTLNQLEGVWQMTGSVGPEIMS
ncbi:MAG: hypothetical protein WA996_01475 [Candidatus Promineifilaceae bacterium]